MFGLISKKKIIEAVKPLAEKYNDSTIDESKTERENICEFYYKSGNCNAINAIMSKLGIKFEEYMCKHEGR